MAERAIVQAVEVSFLRWSILWY